jgi:tetratricopeptide (TPR) repeat protein
MYMASQKWSEGAAALEDWLAKTQDANSAAYYLLAVAYYQLEDYERALSPAQKAVEMTENPQESWLQLILALRLQRNQYAEAVPLLERLITLKPDSKSYWLQLSSVYGQLEDYAQAAAVIQVAHSGGLVNGEEEVRRLVDLLLMNGIPYRGARILEAAIAGNIVKADSRAFEKLADCWIAAGEFGKAVAPLERAAKLADDGDLFVRLGEVHIQREEWPSAAEALERGIDKGSLSDTGNAELLMGIALLNQQKMDQARDWFERAARSPNRRSTARSYLQVIDAQTGRG